MIAPLNHYPSLFASSGSRDYETLSIFERYTLIHLD
jgi:hypothetical protein